MNIYKQTFDAGDGDLADVKGEEDSDDESSDEGNHEGSS